MKLYNLVMVLFVFSCLASCNKSGDAGTLVAKWNLVNDSIADGGAYGITQTNYIGVPGDYFDFRTNGKLYIKEGTFYDTMAYHVADGNSVIINNFDLYNNDPVIVQELSQHNATFSGSYGAFEIYLYRKVNLRK